jgi:NADPH-dependent curcumin reductase CurA
MGEMQRAVTQWLAAGRLRHRETIVNGLERAPEALARMLTGDTIGKTLVRIA